MSLLLLIEYLLMAVAGVWLQFAGLALFCLTGITVLQFIVQRSPQSQALPSHGSASGHPGAALLGEELDLGFSVLRQQATTERTKLQLYELALEHEKKGDQAKAERVYAIWLPGTRAIGMPARNWKN